MAVQAREKLPLCQEMTSHRKQHNSFVSKRRRELRRNSISPFEPFLSMLREADPELGNFDKEIEAFPSYVNRMARKERMAA